MNIHMAGDLMFHNIKHRSKNVSLLHQPKGECQVQCPFDGQQGFVLVWTKKRQEWKKIGETPEKERTAQQLRTYSRIDAEFYV